MGLGPVSLKNETETLKRVPYGRETRFRLYWYISRTGNVTIMAENAFPGHMAAFPSLNNVLICVFVPSNIILIVLFVFWMLLDGFLNL